jgi:uncharacterized DUF497 family protein
MHDRNFEWDSEKAAANWRDHGVTFDQATKAVRDAFAIGSGHRPVTALTGSVTESRHLPVQRKYWENIPCISAVS